MRRLLQLCARRSVRLRISAVAAHTSRGRSVCSRSPAARPRHSRTPDTSLAASASTHHVQVMRTDARRRLRICAHLSTRRHRTSLSAARKSSSTVGGQRMFRRTTRVIVGRFHSVLCCRPASLE